MVGPGQGAHEAEQPGNAADEGRPAGSGSSSFRPLGNPSDTGFGTETPRAVPGPAKSDPTARVTVTPPAPRLGTSPAPTTNETLGAALESTLGRSTGRPGTDSLSSDPRSSDPVGPGPRTSDPLGATPRTAAALGASPRATESSSSGPRGAEASSSGPREGEPSSSGPRGTESLGSSLRAAEAPGSGSRSADVLGSAAPGAELLGSGSHAVGSPGPDTHAVDTLSSGSSGVDSLGSGSHGVGSLGVGSLGVSSLGSGSRDSGSHGTGSNGAGAHGIDSLATGSLGTGSSGVGPTASGSLGSRLRDDRPSADPLGSGHASSIGSAPAPTGTSATTGAVLGSGMTASPAVDGDTSHGWRALEDDPTPRPPAPRRSASLEDAEPVRRGRRAAPDDDISDDTALRPGDIAEGHIAFWDDDAIRHFRAAWHEVKAEFVDDPVTALTRAHDLLTDAVNELTESLLAERDELDPLRGSANPDTESMRMSMRGYREFLERILAL